MKLYRAVSPAEMEDIRSYRGSFRDSRNQTGEKGFFFAKEDAMKLAAWLSLIENEQHIVVMAEASEAIVSAGREHIAAMEGRGVYLRIDDLASLNPAIEVTS